MDNNITFWELIKSEVNIPIIQRDYAQGRVEEKTRRDDFLGVLYDHLTDLKDGILNLDFVYGRKEEGKNVFFPIDGQQRLTTLFLLHWYIAKKEGIGAYQLKKMKNFKYATRISSREFCETLIDKDIQIPLSLNDDEFSKSIRNKFWFRDAWNKDPTIQAMLVMLQAIHDRFYSTNDLWTKLTVDNLISFQILDLGEKGFELTDELYIKMNARGKQLTDFENFKASFIKMLKDNYPENQFTKQHPINKRPMSFCDYFSYRIEKEWCDLFWQYKIWNEVEKTYSIDNSFMNYFYFIAQMFYFMEHKNVKTEEFQIGDFSIIENVFKKEQAILFLFNSLDFFYKISSENNIIKKIKIDTFFENIFLKGNIDDTTYLGQVRIFDEKGIYLFERCLEEGVKFDNRNSIILFCVIEYVIKYNLTEANKGLRNYTRVVRNLLHATRQIRETVYESDVRINNFGSYWNLFEQLLSKVDVYDVLLETINNKGTDRTAKALNNEKEKAEIIKSASNQDTITALFKLEEFEYFRGLIHNLYPKKNIDNFINWSKSVREIWSCSDDLVVASLITCDFSGFNTKKEFWFWGQKDNWNTILAGQNMLDNKLSDPILLLLNKYDEKKLSNFTSKPHEILDKIIQEFLNSLDEKNWQYYFCKYKEEFLNKTNYYWRNNGEFEHEILGNTGLNPLLSYHINPYVKTVSNLLDNTICEERFCYGRYSEVSCLRLINDFSLYSKQDGWHILPEGQTISDALRKKYNISEQNIFSETNGKDRIEIAVEFCNEFFEQ